MSFVFTPVFTDTFLRANESPLNPTNWHSVSGLPTNDQLQVLNNKCATTVTVQDDGQATVIAALPNDQYCECKITNFTATGSVVIYVRAGVDLAPNYTLTLGGPFNNPTANYSITQVDVSGGTIIHTWADTIPITFQVNDVVRFAIIGSYPTGKLYFFQNNNLIFTGNLGDSPSGLASGRSGLQLASFAAVPVTTDAEVINYVAGSASGQASNITNASWLSVNTNNLLRGSRSH